MFLLPNCGVCSHFVPITLRGWCPSREKANVDEGYVHVVFDWLEKWLTQNNTWMSEKQQILQQHLNAKVNICVTIYGDTPELNIK